MRSNQPQFALSWMLKGGRLITSYTERRNKKNLNYQICSVKCCFCNKCQTMRNNVKTEN